VKQVITEREVKSWANAFQGDIDLTGIFVRLEFLLKSLDVEIIERGIILTQDDFINST
jgi:hypothetical protein